MDFSYPPHVEEIVQRVHEFLKSEVFPLENLEPDMLDGEMLQTLRQKAKAAGVYAPQLPVEWGGLGLNLQEIIPVFEVAGRSLLGPLALNCAAPDEGNMHLLLLAANEEQKERYLAPLAAGTIRSCFGMTEPPPGNGSDPNMLLTTAERDGDEWVVNGHKWFSTGADGAAFIIIMALTDPERGPRQGATMFITPMDTPGIELVRRVPVMGAEAPGGHGELRFTNLRVPHTAILGKEGQGYALAQVRLGPARLTHCMRWTGIAERAVEIAARYASVRQAFGNVLAQHQSVQWMLADSVTEIHAGKLIVRHAAWLLEQGERARSETSMAKIVVAETVNRVLDRAIQICGGMGISRDLPLSRWYEEARAFRIYDGPSEVHRMVVARGVIKNVAAGEG